MKEMKANWTLSGFQKWYFTWSWLFLFFSFHFIEIAQPFIDL